MSIPNFTPADRGLVALYVDDTHDTVYHLPVVAFACDEHTGTPRAMVCDPGGAVFICDDDEVTAYVDAEFVAVCPDNEWPSAEDLNERLKIARAHRRKMAHLTA